MSFDRDYYAVLGVQADADEKALKRSYRNLARRYHPDVSREAQSLERFREIQEAYDLLRDPEQRRAYDHWRQQQWLDQTPPLLLRVQQSQEFLPCLAEPQLLYLLVEVQAPEEIKSLRLPINLCLVLDRSTSMKGDRLRKVKEAARYIVDQLQSEDILSLVVFDDRADLALPGEPGLNRGTARSAINQIDTGGGTEILQGLKLGWTQIRRWQAAGNVSHLILLTDGQTYGDEEGCLEMARLAAREHVSLTLMGVGSDWNDKLLDQMAELAESPGGSVYIDTPDKIVSAFQQQVRNLRSIYAPELALTLHLNNGTALKDAFRVSPQIGHLTFVNERARLAPLQRGCPQVLILELLVDSRNPGEHRLAQIDVEGVVPAVDPRPIRASYTLTVTFDPRLEQMPPIQPDIASAMNKLTIFKMQERTMADIELGRVERAVSRLSMLATRLLDVGEVELARAALLEAGHLAQTGSLSPTGSKKIRYGTRGLQILPKEDRDD
jgi:Ca-activated chloride channel family protein